MCTTVMELHCVVFEMTNQYCDLSVHYRTCVCRAKPPHLALLCGQQYWAQWFCLECVIVGRGVCVEGSVGLYNVGLMQLH